jgi:hypothetical protein
MYTPKLDFVAFTLEDVPRPVKVQDATCIPAGVYALGQRKAGKFFTVAAKKYKHDFVVEILNIPNYSDVLIHWGNTHINTRGCPLLGASITYDVKDSNYEIPGGHSMPGYLHAWNELLHKVEPDWTIHVHDVTSQTLNR